MVSDTTSKSSQRKKSSGENDNGHGLVKNVADAICEKHFFAVDAGGRLYHYRDGVYIPNGETVIKQLVKRHTVATMQDKNWHRSLNADVIEFISIDAPILPSVPSMDVLNLRNGLLRLRDRVLLPHTPRHLSPIQLPIEYKADAVCSAIDKFISQVFPEDTTQLGYELPGWLMLPITSIQKAILLNGPGGNGKSVYLNMLCRFLGKSSYSSLALHKLESDRFAASRLIGKLANICPDLPTESLTGTSTFKAITGGDTLTAEYKFRDSFDFEPFARLVFSSNALPQSNDNSQGFFDRWVVVPFERSFRGTSEEIPRAQLDASLTSDTELSGLLNRALDAIEAVKARKWRLHSSPTLQRAHSEFHSITDPLGVWLDQFTVDDPESVTPKSLLRGSYAADCERKGRPAPTDTAFGTQMKKHRPSIELKQRTVGGRLQWCYVGLGMRSDDAPTSQTSQTSQGYPPISLSTNTTSSRTREDRYELIETSKHNLVNPVNPVNEKCDIPRENEVSPSLDDINAQLNLNSFDDEGVDF